MNIEAINIAGMSSRPLDKAAERVNALQKNKEEVAQEPQVDKAKVAPEELLQQIKSLTEEGTYSVHFERDERASQLVVKIVNRETDETIRQVPAEELLELSVMLEDMRGNIVNTQG
ncbi:MAG: flagellar protein FlaG [Thermodesulfobacteriota bacterium]|nr:flagellar protein FlaG [Thermodesulfobacteriota bacterium]